MACGCPVLVSNQSCLPEIAGKACMTFNPHRVDALVELLYNALMSESLRLSMSQNGIRRASEFSWRKTAGQTLEVYRRVLGG